MTFSTARSMMRRTGGAMGDTSLPTLGLKTSVARQPESSNPELSQPSMMSRASKASPL